MVFDYLKGINLERYKSYLNEKNLKFSISGALLLVFSLEFSSKVSLKVLQESQALLQVDIGVEVESSDSDD